MAICLRKKGVYPPIDDNPDWDKLLPLTRVMEFLHDKDPSVGWLRSRSTLGQLIAEGDIKCATRRGNMWLISPRDVISELKRRDKTKRITKKKTTAIPPQIMERLGLVEKVLGEVQIRLKTIEEYQEELLERRT